METKQINLKLPVNLFIAANEYARNFGYRNLQDLATDCVRQKVFVESEFDHSFTEKEINLVDAVITKMLKEKDFGTEEELNELLLGK